MAVGPPPQSGSTSKRTAHSRSRALFFLNGIVGSSSSRRMMLLTIDRASCTERADHLQRGSNGSQRGRRGLLAVGVAVAFGVVTGATDDVGRGFGLSTTEGAVVVVAVAVAAALAAGGVAEGSCSLTP